MKYKILLILALLFIYASSCKEDEDITPFDHAAQALKDNDSLVKYMQMHFINEAGEIEEVADGEESIYDSTDLITKLVKYSPGSEEIEYKLYYYKLEEGLATEENPTRVDKVNVSYKGFTLDNDVFDQNDFGSWFDLYSELTTGAIPGWSHSIIHFKPGTVTILPDESHQYDENGKGYLFIPSGLAYADAGEGTINPNESLVFYIELNEVFRSDYDSDTVLSMFEDINNDGNFNNDDTDADKIPNYLDKDDDGDGTLTKDENPDPNGDENPEDAIDTNGNGTPDYLDPTVS